MSNPATSSPDLEHFRQQWQQEVQAKSQQKPSSGSADGKTREPSSPEQRKKPERPINRPPGKHPLSDQPEDDIPASGSAEGLVERVESLQVAGDADADEFSKLGRDEPQTALEHYERAVEKEGQGKLGDSLAHYRTAFKLDENVDKQYKDKYFAHKWKANKPAPVSTPTGNDLPSASHQVQPEPQVEVATQTTAQLIAGYADCEIVGVKPIIEGDIPPPCAIKKLPTEVLLELLRHVATKDVSVYVRLGTVCKKLAYHVFSEQSTWRRIALGDEFGLASQQYHFSTDLQGRPSIWQALADDDEDEKPMPAITSTMFPEDQDWKDVFQSHPRIRFTGIYISTVNYTRAGGASVTPSSWGQQVHIVTYYRYLRFFRDGTLISLLTTHEPIDVVGLLTKENLTSIRSSHGKDVVVPHVFAGHGHTIGDRQNVPPTAQNILRHALRGRWRLCHPSLETTQVGPHMASPGDIHIETEGGAGPRYMYTMHLSLKTGNTKNKSATKNNKLVWKGFWSYNTISQDWAEFHLRNDKAFWFSRVKSYGLGY